MNFNEWIVEVKDENDKVVFTQLYEDYEEANSAYLRMKELPGNASLKKSDRKLLNG